MIVDEYLIGNRFVLFLSVTQSTFVGNGEYRIAVQDLPFFYSFSHTHAHAACKLLLPFALSLLHHSLLLDPKSYPPSYSLALQTDKTILIYPHIQTFSYISSHSHISPLYPPLSLFNLLLSIFLQHPSHCILSPLFPHFLNSISLVQVPRTSSQITIQM